jgi:hypothetical protein
VHHLGRRDAQHVERVEALQESAPRGLSTTTRHPGGATTRARASARSAATPAAIVAARAAWAVRAAASSAHPAPASGVRARARASSTSSAVAESRGWASSVSRHAGIVRSSSAASVPPTA